MNHEAIAQILVKTGIIDRTIRKSFVISFGVVQYTNQPYKLRFHHQFAIKLSTMVRHNQTRRLGENSFLIRSN